MHKIRSFDLKFGIGDLVQLRRWDDETSSWIIVEEYPPFVVLDLLPITEVKDPLASVVVEALGGLYNSIIKAPAAYFVKVPHCE